MRVVLKVGGSVLAGHDSSPWFEELIQLQKSGHQCSVVHGGGATISSALSQIGEPVQFIEGQRVTTENGLTTVVRVLAGEVNKTLVSALAQRKIRAVGLSGVDGHLIEAKPAGSGLGRVGNISKVEPQLLDTLWQGGYTPVIAPVAADGKGGLLNCNGDFVAAAVASALLADILVFYTDSGGLREHPEDSTTVVDQVRLEEIDGWIDSGRASGGMVPKLRAARNALTSGVGRVRIGAIYDQFGPSTELYGRAGNV